jgi:hypothetical protein
MDFAALPVCTNKKREKEREREYKKISGSLRNRKFFRDKSTCLNRPKGSTISMIDNAYIIHDTLNLCRQSQSEVIGTGIAPFCLADQANRTRRQTNRCFFCIEHLPNRLNC